MVAEQTHKRIIKNTLMLYIRQVVVLIVSLYTVRVVLNALGVEDYGIYSVVGGIVSLFTFLSGTMASATQRFFSFAIGRQDIDRRKKIFTVNGAIYLAIAAAAFLLLESVGLWFVNEHLNVPISRLAAVHWVYQFSIFSFIMSIISTPFMAIIMAHEDMKVYAYASIVEAALKIVVVVLLVQLPGDRLKVFGALSFVLSVFTSSMYIVYCFIKYQECQLRLFYWDRRLFREIMGFTGWTLLGQLSTVVRNQAVTLLLNQMYSPVIVAARAIATNIAGQVGIFSNSFNSGIYPPIIKSYAANNKIEMFSLIFGGSKVTFFLMWIFSLPMILEMNTILTVWLKNPPVYAVIFTQLSLVEVLINSVSLPVTTAARAPGKMKLYELTLGSIQMLIFFASWIVLFWGASPNSVFIVAIIANVIMFAVRLFIVRSLIGLSLEPYFRMVIIPIAGVACISAFLSSALHLLFSRTLLGAILSTLLSMLISAVCMFLLGLTSDERSKVQSLVTSRLTRSSK